MLDAGGIGRGGIGRGLGFFLGGLGNGTPTNEELDILRSPSGKPSFLGNTWSTLVPPDLSRNLQGTPPHCGRGVGASISVRKNQRPDAAARSPPA